MRTYQPISILPIEFQRDWLATLLPTVATPAGAFRLVGIKRTEGQGYMGQRINVLVVDENGFPLPGVRVAFSFSTADQYFVAEAFDWMPPMPHKAFIVSTNGAGQCDQVQGSVVRGGQPGGVTVYCLEPEFASDVVAGCGMLANHDGLLLTFQLRRTGVRSIEEQLATIEDRLAKLEAAY